MCANAPMVQIGRDTFEDLTPRQARGRARRFRIGQAAEARFSDRAHRIVSGGRPDDIDGPALYDGSTIGAWKKRFEEAWGPADSAEDTTPRLGAGISCAQGRRRARRVAVVAR